jgi:hypothetical protein
MESLALEDFERFKLMKDFTHHVGAILAMVNDVLRPRSFEEFERYGFGEVSLV